MQKHRLLEQALPYLFPFSLPPLPPLFAPATQAIHTTSFLFQVFQVFSGLSFSGLSFSGLSYHLPPFFRSFRFFQVFPFQVFFFSGLSFHLSPFFRSFRFFQVFLFQVFPFQVFHSTSLLLSLLKQTVSELIHFCYSLSS